MNNRYLSIILFGFLLAALALFLQYFEYRYIIGRLDVEVYTLIVAGLFTVVGVWVGLNLIRKKNTQTDQSHPIDTQKLESFRLNKREYEILQLISAGHSNQEIADMLFIALPTVKTHTSNLYSKLNVKSRTQAIHLAKSEHII